MVMTPHLTALGQLQDGDPAREALPLLRTGFTIAPTPRSSAE
jgi:hypothetical protein